MYAPILHLLHVLRLRSVRYALSLVVNLLDIQQSLVNAQDVAKQLAEVLLQFPHLLNSLLVLMDLLLTQTPTPNFLTVSPIQLMDTLLSSHLQQTAMTVVAMLRVILA